VTKNARPQITGIILSGGRGSRMGGIDKGFAELAGKPLVEHAITLLRPQVDSIIISANRETERYAQYGYLVVRDTDHEFSGPLSGIASCLFHARTPLAMIIPCDMPYLPDDLVMRMHNTLEKNNAEICMAHDGEHLHPVVCLVKTELLEQLVSDIEAGERKTRAWMEMRKYAVEDFSDQPHAFANVNRPEELQDSLK